MEIFLVRCSVMVTLAMSLAGCDEAGNRRQVGDVGTAPINDTSTSPKADWVDNNDGSTDGVATDGSDDGTDTTDSSDASDGSDATDASDSSDSTDATDGVVDCSVPPDDCELTDGQLKICTNITGGPENIWSFWNKKTCMWDLYGTSWPKKSALIYPDVPAHTPGETLSMLGCSDPEP